MSFANVVTEERCESFSNGEGIERGKDIGREGFGEGFEARGKDFRKGHGSSDESTTTSITTGSRSGRRRCGEFSGIGVPFCGEFGHLTLSLSDGAGFERNVVQLPRDETALPRKENEISSSRFPCSTRSTNSVDVEIPRSRDTNLNDAGDSRVIDSSG